MILYKRNSKGLPIFWEIHNLGKAISVQYGLVGREGHLETFNTHRKVQDEINSLIKAKRKEGYKTIEDLYDNAPKELTNNSLYRYLDTYLPKFNTHEDGKFIPMLCKTLEDNKPFEKGTYFGQWKINGERCIITMTEDKDLFKECRLNYRSRQGVDWTDKLFWMDAIIIPLIPKELKELMLEEGAALDGELYLPGYGINEINHFIKNVDVPQHYKLQFWCYDIAVDNMSADARQVMLNTAFFTRTIHVNKKDTHLNNKSKFVVLPNEHVADINAALKIRDKYIDLGFEGLVIRESGASYQFGGRRNNSMLKYKKKYDGLFTIYDIIPEGTRRANLPKFVLINDINDAVFECSLNAPHSVQENILKNKSNYTKGNYKALVEYYERSGVNQVPFHSRIIKLIPKNES